MSGKSDLGNISISEDVIAIIAGVSAMECYGLVGMASGTFIDGIAQLLGKEDLKKGVEVVIEGDEVTLTLNIIVGFGVNISEVARNVIERVQNNVQKQSGLKVKHIYVNVQGVKLIN